jgi:small conductance mechanosensitive channel
VSLLTAAAGVLAAPTPEPSETPTVESPVEVARAACQEGATICTVVTDLTGNPTTGQWTQVLVGTPLRVLLVLVVGYVLRRLLHVGIDRVVERVAEGDTSMARSRLPGRAAAVVLDGSPLTSERRVQRARTMGSVLRSTSTGVIAVVMVLMVLAELGLNVAPLLAGAGILGVALGFGSQTLVKDFLSGIFMIVEDQYGVGDVVDLGEATGSVEAVGLRVTRVRDVNGTVWYVRNGEILRVGNQSQGWARAVIDVQVAHGEDLPRVQELLAEVGRDLHADPEWAPLIMEDPEVWGVEALTADAVVVRLVVKTLPLEQWVVARELRLRIKAVFEQAGVEMPFAQRTVWMRDGDHRPSADAGTSRPQGSPGPPAGEAAVASEVTPDGRDPDGHAAARVAAARPGS